MGRPLKMTETVGSSLKVGVLGNTSQTGNQLQFTGFVAGGTAKTGYASRQSGSKTFKVTTADGTADLVLTADSGANLVAGQCQLTATDSAGGTYFVSKISANHVTIGKLGSGTQFPLNSKVVWVTSGPVINVSVSLPVA